VKRLAIGIGVMPTVAHIESTFNHLSITLRSLFSISFNHVDGASNQLRSKAKRAGG
jgi:hypothetical protein